MNFEIEEFCCECSLVADAIDTLAYIYTHKPYDFTSIAIIAPEYETELILKHIIQTYDVDINFIYFDKDDYDDEYGITLTIQDDKLILGVETATGYDGYKKFELDYIYVSENTDADFIKCQDLFKSEIDIFSLTGEC